MITRITMDEAKALWKQYRFSYQIEMSRVTIGANKEPDWNELDEAYFFDQSGEMHIYREKGCLYAAKLDESADEQFIDEEFCLENRFGRTLTKRKVLGFDDDGQAYIKYSRLADWKED